MKLYLFGPLRLEFEQQIRLVTGPAAGLLGMLALSEATDYALSRSRLVGTLWPDIDEDRARHLLSNTLYRLRRMLGSTAVHLHVETDIIALNDVWVDVTEFRRLLAAPNVNNWLAAFDLYNGDLLEEVDAFWLLNGRVQLRELFLNKLAQACTILEQQDRETDTLLTAHRWALADPLNEMAHKTVMRLLARQGRHAAALQQYETLRQLLADELDIEPLPEIQTLAHSLRQARQQRENPPPLLAAPLIGRQQERAHLISQLEKCSEGRGQIILIEGEAGMGKTRLLQELATAATWRDLPIAWGQTADNSSPQLYAPLPQALQAATAGPRLDQINPQLTPTLRELLAPLLPRLRGPIQHLPPLRPARPSPKLPMGTAVTKLLTALTTTSPLLLIFDDVQWADQHFWELLPVLAAASQSQPLLIILSCRPRELRANHTAWTAVQALNRDHHPLHLPLTGLDVVEIQDLAQTINQSLTQAESVRLHQLSGGNPLVIKEMLMNEDAASPSFEDLLASHLDQLKPDELAALTAASVLGREFSHTIWQAVFNAPLPAATLCRCRFLQETEQGYTFQHDLVRAHIYNTATVKQRQGWHQRVAAVLLHEEAGFAELAWHFEQAGSLSQAIYYHRRAAERALKLEDHEAARTHCELALKLGGETAVSSLPLRCLRLQIKQIETWSSAHAVEAAEIEQLAEQQGDQETLLKIMLVRLNYLTAQGQLDPLQTLADRILQFAAESGDRSAEIQALNQVAHKILFSLGDVERPIALSQRAITLAETLPHEPYLLVASLLTLTVSYLRACQLPPARKNLARAESIITARPEMASLSGELLYYQAITAQLGLEWEKSRLYQHRLIELNRQANNFGGLAAALFNSAHVASFIGQHEEAILFAEELVQYVAANITEDDAYLLHVYRTMLLDCYTMGGQYEAAEKVVAQLLPWLTAEEEGRAAISGWSAVGTYHFYRQNLEASYYAHSRAITLAEKIGSASSSPFLCHAEVAALTNRLPEAQTSFSKATERIDLQHSGSNITFYYYVYYLLSRDVQHLNAARDNMLALVNHLHDPHLRHDYLHRMPLHADIAALWEAQAFTRVQVPLARLDAPLGRPLTNNDRIEVVWTVDAGELDTAVHQQSGKVAQRRCRLQRLAAEARAQGAAPTHADLAQALGVNVRTIERDSAALETAGTPLFTRRVQTKQAPE